MVALSRKLGKFSVGLVALSVAASAQAWDGKTVKVCADPNNPPYSDRKGQGFENKIADLLGKSVGKPVEYAWFPQRIGFIRNTLKAQLPDSDEYLCDVIMGMPTGSEMVATTDPYYRSTYSLVYARKRGWDDIRGADDLAKLSTERRAKHKLAMFDNSPATTWMLNHQLVQTAIPYQSMSGDAAVNTATVLEQDIKAGKLDMAIVWGPIAGYLEYAGKAGTVAVIPMPPEPGLQFVFPISMAVRVPDKARKQELNEFLQKNSGAIQSILRTFKVPLVDEQGHPLNSAAK
jgi:quinoprotein dehydrogenase-associated probable ABC transporter substrate-binding protein